MAGKATRHAHLDPVRGKLVWTSRHLPWCMSVASNLSRLQHHQIAGNPLEPKVPRLIAKASTGREQTSGMVIILRIGQSASKPLKSKCFTRKVQRLNGDGSLRGLRYSLVPGFNPDKYPEREGIFEKLQREHAQRVEQQAACRVPEHTR